MILKEEMGVDKMLKRERELLDIIWPELEKIPSLHLLAANTPDRLGIISFYIEGLHYNLGVQLLNDCFGIQVRGGCSCAGTYGHYLLQVSHEKSQSITSRINQGDLSEKPGWIRLSVNPTMTDDEAHQLVAAIKELSQKHQSWGSEYAYDIRNNEFFHKNDRSQPLGEMTAEWYENFRQQCSAFHETDLMVTG